MTLMSEKKYIEYSTEDFILDDDFMQWVLHPNQETDQFWNHFLKNHPAQQNSVNEAAFLIRSLRVVEPSVSQHQLQRGYPGVQPFRKHERNILQIWTRIAALVILLVSIGGLLYYFSDNPERLPFEAVNSKTLEKGKVIHPDGTVSEFETEQTEIIQKATGELTINDDTVTLNATSETGEERAFAEVIIPFGKRSEVTLTDGTKIWLNSGSRLSYPVNFSSHLREVYLEGEAFFDVKSDPSNPFQVVTHDMKIHVTGTRFNVSSYANDQTTQTVLLSGEVSAKKNKRFAIPMELKPGERIVYDRKKGDLTKDQVNVELYASWVNGYLLFEKEPVDEVFKKLERYYNKNIITEKLTGQITFSGKLNLADDLEKVLDNIAFSASFSVDYKNDDFVIKPIEKK